MARRKRLSAATITDLPPEAAPEVKSDRPPIASVVADAANQAALREVATEYAAARAEGRMVVLIPLEQIKGQHLVRDRVRVSDEEMASLKSSIAERGQQTPIEVEDLGEGTYGLISGWRRLEASRDLLRETGDVKFGKIKALIKDLDSKPDAYIAMVEENEIRANLSFYERARIAHAAAEQGVFPTAEIAVRELFRNASRPKRSKILSFLRIFRALDGVLVFPTVLSERQGLALAKVLDRDEEAEDHIKKALKARRAPNPSAEMAVLIEAVDELDAKEAAETVSAVRPPVQKRPKRPDLLEVTGIEIEEMRPGRVSLAGSGVDSTFLIALTEWLVKRSLVKNSH